MRRSTRMRLRQAGISACYFLVAALLLGFNDFYFRQSDDLRQVGEYYPALNWILYIAGGLLAGTLFSIFEFFLLQNLFVRYGLVVLTVGRAFFLMALYIFMTTMLSVVYNSATTGHVPWAPEVRQRVWEYLTGPVNAINQVFYFVFALILVYFHQVAAIVGPGMLGKFLFARYRRPGVVERVFVFLDVNSSTRIAEEIGADRFFALIQDFLVEAGHEILEHGGEIYKYVGDEIIAVWPVEEGARQALALACLVAIRRRLSARADYYRDRYGHVPEFKSGVHVGEAIVGELGDWKREIGYMGDVLNTTARIQGACKKAGTWVLLSEAYRELVREPRDWRFYLAGRGRLRGKATETSLYGIQAEDAPATARPRQGALAPQ